MSKQHHGRPWRPVAVMMVLVSAVCIGVLAEARWDMVGRARNYARAGSGPALDGFAIAGDPALAYANAANQPRLPDAPADADAFRAWQSALRNRLANDLFQLGPAAPAPRVEVISSVEVEEGLSRQFVSFSSFDGASIPAFIFRHASGAPRPAVLVLPGHVRPGSSGIDQTAGLVDSYQHAGALELARAGYVTMTIEFRGFGYLGPPTAPEHRMVAHNAIAAGSFYRSILARDIQVAMTVLSADSEVDSSRIAMAGVSLGGEMVTTYAALDERVAAVVVQGYGGSVGQPARATSTEISRQPHFCHLVPGQMHWYDDEDLFLLISRRPLLVVRGSREGMPEPAWQQALSGAYGLLSRPDGFEFRREPGGHEFFVEPAISFLNKHLKTGP